MANKLTFSLLLLSMFSLLQVEARTTTSRYSTKHTIIENPKTQLVLDGTETTVIAKRPSDSLAQSWHIDHTDSGTFRFTNMKTNKVLAVKKSNWRWQHKVITSDLDLANEYQQWYVNSDGTIVNAGDKELALEIDILNNLELTSPDTFGNGRQKFRIRSYIKY